MAKAKGKQPRQRIMPGAEFRTLRKSVGYSQSKLGDLFGCSQSVIANWERDARPVPKWAVFILRVLLAKRQALITGQRPTLETD